MTQSSGISQRGAIAALSAAFLGWLFDGFEMGLFPLIGRPALQELLPDATASVQSQWFMIIIAVFLVGAATGGVLFGWLGDKIGRVKAMIMAIVTYAIFTGFCGFVHDASHFAVLRFFASLGMGGEWALGVALVNEIWGSKSRAWIAGLIGAASNIGFLMTGILSLKLNASLETVEHWIMAVGINQETADFLLQHRGWRFLTISGAFPAILAFFIQIFVPESPKWKEEKLSGATSRWANVDILGVIFAAILGLGVITIWAPGVFEKLGNAIAVPITLVLIGGILWGYLLPVRRYMTRSVTVGSLATADRRKIMRHLMIGAAISAVALMGTWGTVQQAGKWASFLSPQGPHSNVTEHTIIALAIGAIVVTIIAPLVADKLGRRLTYFLLCILAMASAIAFFQLNHSYEGANVPFQLMLTAFLIGGLTASFYGFFPLYLPELFPTSVRATGQGFCYNFGRLIAAIGSLQFANLMGFFGKGKLSPEMDAEALRLGQIHIEANAYSVLACIYIIGMIIIWYAPETKGHELD